MTDESFLIEGGEVGADEVGPNAVQAVMVELRGLEIQFSALFLHAAAKVETDLAAELDRGVVAVDLVVAVERDVLVAGHRVEERISRQVGAAIKLSINEFERVVASTYPLSSRGRLGSHW
jgi:hypothetical protein